MYFYRLFKLFTDQTNDQTSRLQATPVLFKLYFPLLCVSHTQAVCGQWWRKLLRRWVVDQEIERLGFKPLVRHPALGLVGPKASPLTSAAPGVLPRKLIPTFKDGI